MRHMRILLRILLSVSVFVSGFAHAMPAAPAEGARSHVHCDEAAMANMHAASIDDAVAPTPHRPADSHEKLGCCKAGSCPCPAAAAFESPAAATSGLGREAYDIAPPGSSYRSAVLERLIRPPIA